MKKARQGLSFLEIVVSLFLFSAVAILLVNLYPATLLGMHQNRNRTHAELLASSALAQVRQSTFDDLPVGLDRIYSNATVDGVDFTTRLQVLQPSRGDPARLRVLRLTTTWNKTQHVVRELWVPRASR